MSKHQKQLYEFNSFCLDAVERVLLRDGEPVILTPKVFDTLAVLVENSGHIVEKDELMKTVWPDTFVEEVNIAVNISSLRKTLGLRPDGKQYIETVPKRGYRFVAEVRHVEIDQDDLILKEHIRSTVESSGDVIINEEGAVGEFAREGALRKPGSTAPDRRVRSPKPLEILAAFISRHKLGAGTIAVSLAVLAAIAYLHFNREPALTERDTILIADFMNTTGDPVFDGTLKQGLAAQLEQSPFLSIFPDQRVQETLRYMGRSTQEHVTGAVAREICERQGIKAMLTGSIASLGSNYAITLEAVNAQTGDVLAREQVEAESKEMVLRRLGEAASRLREKVGESISTIRKFDVPIAQATTSSLEALKAYSLGRAQHIKGNFSGAIPLYKHAIELDPDFALAYGGLSSAHNSMFQFDLAGRYGQRAFELRSRVSERERLYISSVYYLQATREFDKAIEVLNLWRQTYPRDPVPPGNLGFAYNWLGQWHKAAEEYREAIRLNPDSAIMRANLGSALLRLGRFDEAKDFLEQAIEQKLDSLHCHVVLYEIAFAQGNNEQMKRQLEWAADKPDEHQLLEYHALSLMSMGRVREARTTFVRASEMAERRKVKEMASLLAAENAMMEAVFGNCKEARAGVSRALSLEPGWIALLAGGMALSSCGDVGQAQSLVDELSKRHPTDLRLQVFYLPAVLAAMELQRSNPDRAIQILEPARPYDGARRCLAIYVRAQAYLHKRMAAEAKAEFQKIIYNLGWDPCVPFYALAHIGLARSEALAGDSEKSRKAYEDFFTLWKDADPDVPILKQARKEYERLVAPGGFEPPTKGL